MNILAFDTCFDACSAAAGRGLRTLTPSIATAFEPMAIGHAERLMPMIESVMRSSGLAYSDLDRIAVTVGPGTFTGTRISVAAARALSLATGVAIVPISSLMLMAMNPAVSCGECRTLVIATDARRGEVYLQSFDSHSLRALSPAVAVALADIAGKIGAGPVVIAGSGASIVIDAARNAGIEATAMMPDLLPDAFDMLFAAADWPVAANVEPLYLRPPDAKPPLSTLLVSASA